MTTSPDSVSSGESAPLTYFVDGMDCATCVQKVEQMVNRLPGAGAVKTSFTRQTLKLELDETQTTRTLLEKNLRALGYTPSLLETAQSAQSKAALNPRAHDDHVGHDHAAEPHDAEDHAGHVHEVLPAGTPWYAGRQGKLVIFSGVLLALAWGLGFVAPQYAVYGYIAATILGVWAAGTASLGQCAAGRSLFHQHARFAGRHRRGCHRAGGRRGCGRILLRRWRTAGRGGGGAGRGPGFRRSRRWPPRRRCCWRTARPARFLPIRCGLGRRCRCAPAEGFRRTASF